MATIEGPEVVRGYSGADAISTIEPVPVAYSRETADSSLTATYTNTDAALFEQAATSNSSTYQRFGSTPPKIGPEIDPVVKDQNPEGVLSEPSVPPQPASVVRGDEATSNPTAGGEGAGGGKEGGPGDKAPAGF